MITCNVGDNLINCYDESYTKEQLKNWSKNNMLLCPACGHSYEYCHGKIKSPYFRHKEKEVCEDKYSESETQEHITGKRDLYEWLSSLNGVTNVKLEGWIPETKQRPDIMFTYNDKQFVIEYQCTPISSEYYERHELYKTIGVNDIWVCGTEKYFQFYHKGNGAKRVNVLEENCGLYYDPMNKSFYKIYSDLSVKNFKSIINRKTYVNLMNSPVDYKSKSENYYLIKTEAQSYSTYSYYPSPTGRKSNKYPYPVTGYRYENNLSLAKCEKIKNINILHLLGGDSYI